MRKSIQLLLTLVFASVWFNANADEPCEVEMEQMEFLEDDDGVVISDFVDASAACLISQSVLLTTDCSPELAPGDTRLICGNPLDHMRIISIVHLKKGYMTCSLVRKEASQAIRCEELNYP